MNYKNSLIKLKDETTIEEYYDFNAKSLKFKEKRLLSEQEYHLLLDSIGQIRYQSIIEQHLDCEICTSFKPSQNIRKRKKLTNDERIQLAFDIGYGANDLLGKWSLSRKTIRDFENKLKSGSKKLARKIRIRRRTALSELEKKRIDELVYGNQFVNCVQVKSHLKLKCCVNTIPYDFHIWKCIYAFPRKKTIVESTISRYMETDGRPNSHSSY